MEFRERIKKTCRVKYVITFCLSLTFLWWGSNAVLRYWSQPLSTDISSKYGETEQGIQFPLITLCDSRSVTNDPILKDCHDGSWYFLSALISCMKSDKTLKVADVMQNFHPEINNIVELVLFWTGLKYVNLHSYGTLWTKVFHPKRGPCFTFDLSKDEKFKYVSLKAVERPAIEFVMAENNLWKDASLMLHTRFDFPDASKLNGFLELSFLEEIHKVHKVEFRKKISKKESTRKAPCVKHEDKTCRSIEDNRVIFERFHCILPILYSEHHLDDLNPKEATNCMHS